MCLEKDDLIRERQKEISTKEIDRENDSSSCMVTLLLKYQYECALSKSHSRFSLPDRYNSEKKSFEIVRTVCICSQSIGFQLNPSKINVSHKVNYN